MLYPTAILGPLLILFGTIALALTEPRVGPLTIRRPAAALLGALASIAIGAVSIESALTAVRFLVEPVTTIVSLMLITLVAERAGFFRILAAGLVVAANGDARRLFTLIFLAGAAAGSVFTNDAVVLIFTPTIVRLIGEIDDGTWVLENKIPYFFAVLYVANLVGGLVISNPINIVVAKFFAISFLEYAAWMIVPAIVSIIATYAGLRVAFRRSLPHHFIPPSATLMPRITHLTTTAGAILVVALCAFFLGEPLGVATWIVAASGAVTLLTATALLDRPSLAPVVRGVGWDVIVFVTGIFIISVGLRNAGLTALLTARISAAGTDLWDLTGTAALMAAGLSAVLNNHPTANLMALAIDELPGASQQVKKLVALSALIGGDLGPKMLPVGSLAALLWLRLLAARGITIPVSRYVAIGVPVTLFALMLAVWTLNLEIAVARGVFGVR